MTSSVESLPLLCPTVEETDLLRACLWSGAAARDAWTRWQRSVGDPEAAIKRNASHIKSLLPLLHHGLRRSGAVGESGVGAALGGATLAERLRYEVYARISARAFDALAAAAVPFIVLRGAALAEAAYPATALRHSHDVDLLIRPNDVGRATDALRQASFLDGTPYDETGTARMLDPSGLPVALHDRLFRAAYYSPPLLDMWTRAQRDNCAGRTVSMLSPADHLVHICGHAACSASRDRLKWAADAWYLLERNPSLDWAQWLETVRASRLALPLATVLRYLAVDLEAPVPSWVLDRLSQTAALAERAAREVALSGVRAGVRGTFRNLIAATHSLPGRLDLARWMLLPSPASLRLGEPLRYPRAWPLYYVGRPLAYAGRRAQRLVLAARAVMSDGLATTNR
jgi:hypothetical protein